MNRNNYDPHQPSSSTPEMTVNKILNRSTKQEHEVENGNVVRENPEIKETELTSNNNDNNTETFRVYKQRWLLLLVPICSDILLLFRSWRFPIINIVYPFWNTTVTQAVSWAILPLTLSALLLIPSGRALDRWGIRKMVYITTPVIIASNVLQSMIMFDETNSPLWIPKQYRFGCFVLSNCLLMVSYSNFNGLTAKIANDWFALDQTTLAIVIPMTLSRFVEASTALLIPKIVKCQDDLKYIGYINLSMTLVYACVAATCVTRSKPVIAPSENALRALQTEDVPLSAFIRLLKIPAFPIAMFASGINIMTLIILKSCFAEALSLKGYTNDFAGLLIAIGAISACLGGLASSWLDRKYDYIRVSKITSLLVAFFFTLHYISQLRKDFAYMIVISAILYYFSIGVLIPLHLQAMLRPSKGLLPDASVAALNGLMSVLCYGIITLILSITKGSDLKNPNLYYEPYVTCCIVVTLTNCLYALCYHPPKPQPALISEKNDAEQSNPQQQVSQ